METVRVTRLNAFRQWLDGRLYIPEDVQERLPDEVDQWVWYINQPVGRAADRGTAFHKVLENLGQSVDHDYVKEGDFTFDFSAVEIEVPTLCVVESKKVVEIEGVNVQGTIDGATPTAIIDWKTTGSYEPDRYADSYQWRFYLSMWGMSEFQYHVFPVFESVKNPDVVQVRGHHVQKQYAYAGMEQDCAALVQEWKRFIK